MLQLLEPDHPIIYTKIHGCPTTVTWPPTSADFYPHLGRKTPAPPPPSCLCAVAFLLVRWLSALYATSFITVASRLGFPLEPLLHTATRQRHHRRAGKPFSSLGLTHFAFDMKPRHHVAMFVFGPGFPSTSIDSSPQIHGVPPCCG